MNKIQISEQQIHCMLHALGIEYISRVKTYDKIVPNKRYSPYPKSYRNYYQDKDNKDFGELVTLGFAEYIEKNEDWQCFYRVTQKGKDFLREIGYNWHDNK